MTIDEFWKLLEGLPEGYGAEDALEGRLEGLEPEALESFNTHFEVQHMRAYSWDLWGAAYLIGDGCSDDGFDDFRDGLISRGREVFEAALANPDSLARLDQVVDSFQNEGFGYVAQRLYEEETGDEMPSNDVDTSGEPTGASWDFDDSELVSKKFPELSKRFG